MNDVESTWLRALKVWWAEWRAAGLGTGIGILLGIVEAAFLGVEEGEETPPSISILLMYPIGILLWIFVLKRYVMGLKFSDFRVALMSIEDVASNLVPRHPRRRLAVRLGVGVAGGG